MGELLTGIDFALKRSREYTRESVSVASDPSLTELAAIGLGIISGQKFQDGIASSPKAALPFDPVAVAIMCSPAASFPLGLDTDPEVLAAFYESSLGYASYLAPESDPA